jgi:prephenate dehydrogenase
VIRCVAIVGLGLIGGSVARDLAARGVRVLGHDRDPASVDAALAERVITADMDDDFGGMEDADVLLLAVPVTAAAEVLERAGSRLGSVRLVTDAGSTKRGILAAAERVGIGDRFVGAHPLAGDHRAGWAASREGLFAGARVYLCPSTHAAHQARTLARALWEMLGSEVMEMDAAAHDERLAWTSHLPQLASTALAAALARRGIARADLGPGGRDVTRLAASSPEMWAAIARENADAILPALDALAAHLHTLRDAIAGSDAEAIRAALAAGNAWSEAG